MGRARIVTARTVRRVWLIAAVAAMWLLVAAGPALAVSHTVTVGHLVGQAFKWGRWAVLLIAVWAVFNVWRKAAMKGETGGGGGLKTMFTIIAGAALVFYFFTNAGVGLLRSTGEAVKVEATVPDATATTIDLGN